MNDKLLSYLAATWMVRRGNKICFFQGELEDLPSHLIVIIC